MDDLSLEQTKLRLSLLLQGFVECSTCMEFHANRVILHRAPMCCKRTLALGGDSLYWAGTGWPETVILVRNGETFDGRRIRKDPNR